MPYVDSLLLYKAEKPSVSLSAICLAVTPTSQRVGSNPNGTWLKSDFRVFIHIKVKSHIHGVYFLVQCSQESLQLGKPESYHSIVYQAGMNKFIFKSFQTLLWFFNLLMCTTHLFCSVCNELHVLISCRHFALILHV